MTLISFQGTKKDLEKGAKIRIMPTRRPPGHMLNVKSERVPTKPSTEPDLFLNVRVGVTSRSGNRRIGKYQPDTKPNSTVTAIHSSTKKNGK
jgi:hypothetical protein